jgi:glycosyltransferase involved in cell wall biosynthesis
MALPIDVRRGNRSLTSVLEDSAYKRPADTIPNQPAQGRPIRVLIVAARFLPELGGIENHIHEVTRRIAKRGDFNLTVLTTDRSGTLPTREEFDGFAVLRCRSYPRHRDYYFAPSLYRLVGNGSYDLVHCQGIHTAVPILAMMAARRARIPYAVSLHTGGHSSEFRHRLRNIQWRTLGPLLRRAQVVVAVSRFEQQIFQKACNLNASRFRIVRNGGDLPVGSLRTDPIPHRIVSSGRLERYKGHQRVIEALPIVQRSIPDATLHILGAGPYEGRLRALIKTLGVDSSVTIEYIAPNDRKRMAESLCQASVFAALSEYEAHPVAVMEALTLGIPTVGLTTTGIGELVDDGLVKGILRDASPTAVANVLVAALNSSYRSAATTLPTWDIAAEDLARVYMDTAGTRPKPLRLYDE